jgi:hypothetical protein
MTTASYGGTMTPLFLALSFFNERDPESPDPSDDYMVVRDDRYAYGNVKELLMLRPEITDQVCLYLVHHGITFSRQGESITLYLLPEVQS